MIWDGALGDGEIDPILEIVITDNNQVNGLIFDMCRAIHNLSETGHCEKLMKALCIWRFDIFNVHIKVSSDN